MTVGHIMLKILAGFVVALGVGGVVPLFFDSCIIIFEMFITLLQAFYLYGFKLYLFRRRFTLPLNF